VQFVVGTSVIYHQHSGVPVYVDGEELLCLGATEIIGSY
jgi:co-chaperonin GroES (HSP10)